MKKLFAQACLLFFMIPAAADTQVDALNTIAAAKAAQKKADELQGAWVGTDKLIVQAEKAVKIGDNKKALELAAKARREAELAYAQAEHERRHWSPPPYARPISNE